MHLYVSRCVCVWVCLFVCVCVYVYVCVCVCVCLSVLHATFSTQISNWVASSGGLRYGMKRERERERDKERIDRWIKRRKIKSWKRERERSPDRPSTKRSCEYQKSMTLNLAWQVNRGEMCCKGKLLRILENYPYRNFQI